MAAKDRKPPSKLRRLASKKWTWLLGGVLLLIVGGALTGYLWQREPVLPQRSITSLRPASLPSSGQKVLFFSPHADDETIAAAGFLTLAIRNGADVRIVLVTDSNKHHNEDMRYTEFKAVAATLGVDASNLVFLGLPDGKLHELDQNSIRQMLKDQIDSYDPQVLLYPHPKDMHPDHATIGKLVADVLGADQQPREAYQYLVHFKLLYPQPRKLDPRLFLLPPKDLVTSDTKWLRVDLPQDVEDIKTLAAFTYRSQLRNVLLRDLILSSIRKDELLAAPAK